MAHLGCGRGGLEPPLPPPPLGAGGRGRNRRNVGQQEAGDEVRRIQAQEAKSNTDKDEKVINICNFFTL